nr:carboxylesterase family protein [Nakamurella leprariae]
MLGQQASLQWVQDEIAALGGDPGAVTIAGESGGSDSVCAQLASPSTSGLFARAVLQSATCSDAS